MKYLFSLLCLTLIFSSCKEEASIPVPGKFDLTGFELKKLDGSDLSYASKVDATGNLLEEGMIRNGLQNGTWLTYHAGEENKIASVSNYVNGSLNGPYMEFNERGQIEKKFNFINGKYHGTYTEYKFGRPLLEYAYKDGIQDGLSKEYSDRGEVIKESNYKDGQLHGNFRQYGPEGKLIMEYEYKNGKKLSGGIVSGE